VAEFLLRWFHYLAAYVDRAAVLFQFCTGPVHGGGGRRCKSTATQKLLPRALAWFRGGAIVTFLTGILIIGKRFGDRRSARPPGRRRGRSRF